MFNPSCPSNLTLYDIFPLVILSVLFQELYDTLEKLRPNLFRLASDVDEKDNTGIGKYIYTYASFNIYDLIQNEHHTNQQKF